MNKMVDHNGLSDHSAKIVKLSINASECHPPI